jgi:hypothetical protein
MHSPHATWETGLVIPEQTKPIDVQMLDAFLRIEALLEKLLGRPEFIPVSQETADMVDEIIEDTTAPKAKGKRTRG